MGKKKSEEAEQVEQIEVQAVSAAPVEAPSTTQLAGSTPQVDLAKVVHLLRRAANSATMTPHDPLAIALRQQVEALLVLGERGVAARTVPWDPLQLIADVLALDPHAEVACRDVRAALEALAS